jgi:hypothetical protein
LSKINLSDPNDDLQKTVLCLQVYMAKGTGLALADLVINKSLLFELKPIKPSLSAELTQNLIKCAEKYILRGLQEKEISPVHRAEKLQVNLDTLLSSLPTSGAINLAFDIVGSNFQRLAAICQHISHFLLEPVRSWKPEVTYEDSLEATYILHPTLAESPTTQERADRWETLIYCFPSLPQALSSFDDISRVKNGLLFCLPISWEFNLLLCGLRPTGDKNTYEFQCFDGASDWVAQYAGRRMQFDDDGIYDPAHPILIELHFSLCCYFEKAPRY